MEQRRSRRYSTISNAFYDDLPFKRNPKFKFREIVRKVINNLFWLSEGLEEERENEIKDFITAHKKEGQVLTFEDKVLLRKPRGERVPEDIQLISEKLAYFKTFLTYPVSVRTQLVWRANFVYHKGGQVVVRQGQPANFMYFIINGVVTSELLEKDPIFTEEMKIVSDKLTTGDCFGDIALMYNEPHTSTVTVLPPGVELLVLNKVDFKSILEKTVQAKWDSVRWALAKFPYYFEKFPESAVRYICSQAAVTTLSANELLPTVDSNGIEIATFVLEGALRVIQRLLLVKNKESTGKRDRYKLYHDQKASQVPDNVRQVFLQTCKLSRTCVIGLGEIMSQHSIMSNSDLLILVIPRYILFRYNEANVWDRVIGMVDMLYPTEKRLLEIFHDNRMFTVHKKNIMKSLCKYLAGLDSTIHDTPVSDRAELMLLSPMLLDELQRRSENYPAFGREDRRLSQVTTKSVRLQKISRIISRGQALSVKMTR